MQRGEIDLVIVGSDRIAANGDVANKIGTYEKAVIAHELGIPFYVAAPTSTIDPDCPVAMLFPSKNAALMRYCSAMGYWIAVNLAGYAFPRRVQPPGIWRSM